MKRRHIYQKTIKKNFEEILAKKVLYEMKNQFFGLKKYISYINRRIKKQSRNKNCKNYFDNLDVFSEFFSAQIFFFFEYFFSFGLTTLI